MCHWNLFTSMVLQFSCILRWTGNSCIVFTYMAVLQGNWQHLARLAVHTAKHRLERQIGVRGRHEGEFTAAKLHQIRRFFFLSHKCVCVCVWIGGGVGGRKREGKRGARRDGRDRERRNLNEVVMSFFIFSPQIKWNNWIKDSDFFPENIDIRSSTLGYSEVNKSMSKKESKGEVAQSWVCEKFAWEPLPEGVLSGYAPSLVWR